MEGTIGQSEPSRRRLWVHRFLFTVLLSIDQRDWTSLWRIFGPGTLRPMVSLTDCSTEKGRGPTQTYLISPYRCEPSQFHSISVHCSSVDLWDFWVGGAHVSSGGETSNVPRLHRIGTLEVVRETCPDNLLSSTLRSYPWDPRVPQTRRGTGPVGVEGSTE